MLAFGQMGRQEIDPLLLKIYARALEGLSPRVLDAACLEALRYSNSARHGFMPSPGEILASVEIVRRTLRALPPIDCKICDGTGWRVIQRDGANCAVRCAHSDSGTPAQSEALKNNQWKSIDEEVAKRSMPKVPELRELSEEELIARRAEQLRRFEATEYQPVRKTPAPKKPQVLESVRPESSDSNIQETHVFEITEADA
jgi:hypothetical protein